MLKEQITKILTVKEPPEAKYHGGVVDWKCCWTKDGLDFLVNEILSLISSEIETGLPKRKRYSDDMWFEPFNKGHNSCLAQIKSNYKKSGLIIN